MTEPTFTPPVTADDQLDRIEEAARQLALEILEANLSDTYDRTREAASALRAGLNMADVPHSAERLLETARTLDTFARALLEERDMTARRARGKGATWRSIGEALGITPGRAQQRYSR